MDPTMVPSRPKSNPRVRPSSANSHRSRNNRVQQQQQLQQQHLSQYGEQQQSMVSRNSFIEAYAPGEGGRKFMRKVKDASSR